MAAHKSPVECVQIDGLVCFVPCVVSVRMRLVVDYKCTSFLMTLCYGCETFCIMVKHIDRSDRRLFYCTRQSHHCHNPLLPPPSPASQTYKLRPRGHAYSLPTVKSTSFMKGFINRALFNFK